MADESQEPRSDNSSKGFLSGIANRQLTIIGIAAVAVLLIAGLILPPISIFDRLKSSDSPTEVIDPASAELAEEAASEDGLFGIASTDKSEVASVSGVEFLSGNPSAESALPTGASLLGAVYTIDGAAEDGVAQVTVKLPDGAHSQAVDLYGWNGDEWVFIPAMPDPTTGNLVSVPGATQKAYVLVQSAPPTSPQLAAEILPSSNFQNDFMPLIDEFSVGTLTLMQDGSLVGATANVASGDYQRFIRATNTGAVVDSASLASLLQNHDAQHAQITDLVSRVSNDGYDGVNVDYQGLTSAQSDEFVDFITELAAELDGAGAELIVTLEAPGSDDEYDWIALGQVADAIHVRTTFDPMAYQAGGAVDEALSWATSRVDRRRLMLSVTAAATEVAGASENELSNADTLASLGSLTIVDGQATVAPETSVAVGFDAPSGELIWNSAARTYSLEQDGRTFWMGNEAGLSYRMGVATRHSLRGVIVRRLAGAEPVSGYSAALASFADSAASPSPRAMAFVWSVNDSSDNAVATENNLAPAFTWAGSQIPDQYTIVGRFIHGDHEAARWVVDVTVQDGAVAIVDPTPLPEESPEPTVEPTSEVVETETPVSATATPIPPTATPIPGPGDADAASTDILNVRSGPGVQYEIISTLAEGEQVTLLGRNDDASWLYIQKSDGLEGWVSADYLIINSTIDVAALPVKEAPPLPTPAPTPTPAPVPTAGPGPVIVPNPGGGFALGGQTQSFSAPGVMANAGMSWVKFQHKWRPGDSPDAVAGRIAQGHASGFKVLLSMPGHPYPSSIDFGGYVEFLRGVAAYGPDAIEIWNEMNLDFEWPAGQISPSSYVNNMLAPGYNAIKSVNPNIMVISGALAPTGVNNANVMSDDIYLAGMAAAGAANYMDCVGVHHNAGATSPNHTSGHPADPGAGHYSWYYWPTLNLYYNSFGGARKVCFTEIGYLSGHDFGGVPPRFSWAGNTTVEQHAQWLGEAASLSANSGKVRLMIIFNVDFTYYADDPQAGYAMIRPGGGCPSCGLLRQVMGG